MPFFQSRVQCGAAQGVPALHEAGTSQGDEGGPIQSLQEEVMEYQLSERVVLPSGWLAETQFKKALWTES